MRPFSPKMYPYTVLVKHRLDGDSDDQTGETPAYDGGTSFAAGVQVPSVTRGPSRLTAPDMPAVTSEESYLVKTPTDPAVKADDLILWLGKTLAVVGPSQPLACDRSGNPVDWLTECVLRT